jgi:hypothetical protein
LIASTPPESSLAFTARSPPVRSPHCLDLFWRLDFLGGSTFWRNHACSNPRRAHRSQQCVLRFMAPDRVPRHTGRARPWPGVVVAYEGFSAVGGDSFVETAGVGGPKSPHHRPSCLAVPCWTGRPCCGARRHRINRPLVAHLPMLSPSRRPAAPPQVIASGLSGAVLVVLVADRHVLLLVLIVGSGRVSQRPQSLTGLRGGDGIAAQHVEVCGLQRGQPRGVFVADRVALGA